jgi:hypothetical protein
MPLPSTGFILFALCAVACANRGMQAPSGGAGATGAGPGVAGTGGGAGSGGSCTTPAPHDAGGACNAIFNFDNGAQGASIAADQAAFTAVTTSADNTYCGAGALAVSATFSGTSGPTTKGIVELPIDAANMDFSGKTLTANVSALPGCSADLGFAVVLRTAAGSETVIPTVRPIGNDWQTLTVTLAGDAGVAGASSVLAISLQAFSSTDYAGTLYIDEVDVR